MRVIRMPTLPLGTGAQDRFCLSQQAMHRFAERLTPGELTHRRDPCHVKLATRHHRADTVTMARGVDQVVACPYRVVRGQS